MSKDKCPECPAGLPAWMATYGDLVTLLMCFFVLLFAFSEIDAQKFEAVMQSFKGSAGILSGGTTISQDPLVFEATPEVTVSETVPITEDIQQLKEQIEAYLEQNQQENIEQDIIVEIDARGLIIRFPDKALFDSGKADLKQESIDTLDFLGGLLTSEEFNMMAIRVEGHTDNIPINTFRYPSNWELSTTRATNVLKYFINRSELAPKRLAASGYGEYYPIEDNVTRAGRSKNRRVDIVILSKHFESVEPTSN